MAQGIHNDAMPYVAPFGIGDSYVALFFCYLIALTKNFNVFTKGNYGNLNYKNFHYRFHCRLPGHSALSL